MMWNTGHQILFVLTLAGMLLFSCVLPQQVHAATPTPEFNEDGGIVKESTCATPAAAAAVDDGPPTRGSPNVGPIIDGGAPQRGGGAPQRGESLGLVQCGITSGTYCTFAHVIELIMRLVRFAVFSLAIPASVIAIMWAGIELIWAQGNPSALEAAKKHMWNIIIGFAIIITAGLIVLTILKAFKVKTDFYIDGIEKTSAVPGKK